MVSTALLALSLLLPAFTLATAQKHTVAVSIDGKEHFVDVPLSVPASAAATQFCKEINDQADNCQRFFIAELERLRANIPVKPESFFFEKYITSVLHRIAAAKATDKAKAKANLPPFAFALSVLTLPRFVQIGAHVGKTKNDPIYHRFTSDSNWTGLLLEPVPHIYNLLEQNYAHIPQFIPVNAAICNTTESQIFYQVGRPTNKTNAKTGKMEYDFFADASQLGSFRRELVEHEVVQFKSLVVPTMVTCLTPFELFRQYGNGNARVDYLQVDAEGMDWEIVGAFLRYFIHHAEPIPAFIRMEWKHLNDATAKDALHVLSFLGYECRPVIASLKSYTEDDMGCLLKAWMSTEEVMVVANGEERGTGEEQEYQDRR